MTKIRKFNIRVYALIINENKEILLSDEYRIGMKMTKFPGGGLKFGEGTIDCLKREIKEEFNQDVEAIDHFYTTDFFQQAFFFPDHQLISIYYLARFKESPRFKIALKPFDFAQMKEGAQSFRWCSLSKIDESNVSLPADKKVVRLLNERFV